MPKQFLRTRHLGMTTSLITGTMAQTSTLNPRVCDRFFHQRRISNKIAVPTQNTVADTVSSVTVTGDDYNADHRYFEVDIHHEDDNSDGQTVPGDDYAASPFDDGMMVEKDEAEYAHDLTTEDSHAKCELPTRD